MITEAGADPKVAGLVYVAAFAPDVGVPVGAGRDEQLRVRRQGERRVLERQTSWCVVAADDRMISPDLERRFATTIKAKTITLASSHVAMLSHPVEVVKLIIDATRTAPAHR